MPYSFSGVRPPGEKLWGMELDPKRGLTVVEIVHAILDDEIHGMYIMGENPAMSDPDAQHAREALAKLEHLVVQDLFLTETAFHADVVLPASAWPATNSTNLWIIASAPATSLPRPNLSPSTAACPEANEAASVSRPNFTNSSRMVVGHLAAGDPAASLSRPAAGGYGRGTRRR